MHDILGAVNARDGTLARLAAAHYLPTAMLAIRRHGMAYEVSPGNYERLQPQAQNGKAMSDDMLNEFQHQSETARMDVTNHKQSPVLNWLQLQQAALDKATSAPLAERYAALTELAATSHAFVSHEFGPKKADSTLHPNGAARY